MTTPFPRAMRPPSSSAEERRFRGGRGPHGQRGASAVFMPSKYVFPGGAVTKTTGLTRCPFPRAVRRDLRAGPPAHRLRRLPGCGARVARGDGAAACPAPGSGAAFPVSRHHAARRPRRFDARFFLADAADVLNDPDDFSAAEDELGHLHWIALAEARGWTFRSSPRSSGRGDGASCRASR